MKLATAVTKADILELVADFIRDGLPEPTSVALYLERPRVLVSADAVPAWCDALGVDLPEWQPGEDETDGWLHAIWLDETWQDKAIELTAVNRLEAPEEVPC
ncbi:hypothetical protein [Nocardioides sp. SR21]|uniref:hypothetical protein n=1 Tax=Nocardioides sp. SR21 TaxID=2919501 RepID=UPI001FAA8B63|nr:hypothetical protein [Nocardioides sp. SR21]